MKALTIKQPWAELIMSGVKDVENRSRRTSFRGRFAVHVARSRARRDDLGLDVMPRRVQTSIIRAWEADAFPGRVIGTVELVDCVRGHRSHWALDGYWHWVLAEPRPYARSVPALGQLNFWEWRR